jgi:hypothetical protein
MGQSDIRALDLLRRELLRTSVYHALKMGQSPSSASHRRELPKQRYNKSADALGRKLDIALNRSAVGIARIGKCPEQINSGRESCFA